MGRILKAQIDKIREMFKAGYTLKEIAKETGVSEPTISKYVSDVSEESRGGPPSPLSPEVELLLQTLFELLASLSCAVHLEPELQSQVWDDQALKIATRLVSINKELAKRVLNDYVGYLKSVNVLNLSVPDTKLFGPEQTLRRGWLNLLKQHAPELLGQLM